MRSLTRSVISRFQAREAAGWNHTTYNRSIKTGDKKSASKELEAYGSISTLFAIVSRISNSCGSVKWRLYRGKEDQRRVKGPVAEDRTEIVKHVALDLWNKPNPLPYMTQSFMMETGQQHVDLTGEAHLLVARSELSTMPLELWPIRPDKIRPVKDSDGPMLLGWIYTGPNDEQIPLEVDEVISVIMPNPTDLYSGLGPVQSLAVDLDATKYAALFNRNFFLNDATPGGIIEMETRLSDAEWNEFSERWRQSHQGVNNAHRVAMIENGGKWKDRQFTMRDMQFSELRDLSDKQIRQAFGMHGHMLGLTEDINRANAEAAEDVYARWVLKPRLDRWKDALNGQLLPLFGSSSTNLEFDFDDPSLEDSEANDARLESKARAAKLLVEAGGLLASVLEAVGLPEIEAAPKEKPVLPAIGPGNSPDQIASVPKETEDSSGEEAA